MRDPEQKISRPRQIFTGSAERHMPAERPAIGIPVGV